MNRFEVIGQVGNTDPIWRNDYKQQQLEWWWAWFHFYEAARRYRSVHFNGTIDLVGSTGIFYFEAGAEPWLGLETNTHRVMLKLIDGPEFIDTLVFE